MHPNLRAAALLGAMLAPPWCLLAQQPGGGRGPASRPVLLMSDGRTDLQGIWTNGTATPLERPAEFADRVSLTESEAAEYEKSGFARLLGKLPKEEIAVSGDLNDAFLDTSSFTLAGERRTSLIVIPANGKLPARLPGAAKEPDPDAKRSFDDPESFDLEERCLMSIAFGSSNATPPMIPNPFGLNFYQIVQTATHVMIFTENMHDVRIVRIGGRHPPPGIQLWRGDSIGRWEGGTLVVDTTNFSEEARYAPTPIRSVIG
jgi:hypothetical protein